MLASLLVAISAATAPLLSRRALLCGTATAPVFALQPCSAVPSTTAITRFPSPDRLVAVGDIHGDCQALVRTLRLAGLYDGSRWSGGKAVLVQVGDVLDRGDEEIEALELLRQLKQQAAADGGRVITLLGNHEVLNAAGITIYASPKGAAAFADRATAFLPGGPLATEFAEWPVACMVGDTVFCHAGLTVAQVAAGLEAANVDAANWLRGGAGTGAPPALLFPTSPGSPRSPLWMRDLSDPPMGEPSAATCTELSKALDTLGAKRLVVGHTVQPQISCGCGCRVFRIDVGLSSVYGGRPQALEVMRNGSVRVLTERGAREV